eukprot:1102495-Pyramimonas_sp.AAC.2
MHRNWSRSKHIKSAGNERYPTKGLVRAEGVVVRRTARLPCKLGSQKIAHAQSRDAAGYKVTRIRSGFTESGNRHV